VTLPISPLVGSVAIQRDERRDRLLLFIGWLMLAAWFWWDHVFWRDEVRAFSLALSGANFTEMLRNVHGEGHPAIWYLILRSAYNLFPYREVLPIAGAVFSVGAMALFALFSPFRLVIVTLVLFSVYGAFEYVAIARNYGIAVLVMFSLAAMYPRIRNSLWLGVILGILCNTNVPSCLVASAFLLFRFIENFTDGVVPTKRDWLIFAGNAALTAFGALLCFLTVYPTFNDAAVSSNANDLSLRNFVAALFDPARGFSHLFLSPVVLAISCFAFVHKPAALGASIAGFIILKLFFYFIYPSYYRHEILYVVFLLSLFWMTGNGAGGTWRSKKWTDFVQVVGAFSFIALLAMQSLALMHPIGEQLRGRPYSRSADVARLLQKPELSGAIVMADPDTMLESLPYYVDNPLWMLRQQRFGKVVRLSRDSRRELTLDDVLLDAERLHRQTGRPIVFLSHLPLRADKSYRKSVMFHDETILTPESVKRFLSSTRHVATLRGLELGDENYDMFVYPRTTL
jgi:hypothetical protein